MDADNRQRDEFDELAYGFDTVCKDVFRKSTVWVDEEVELLFYRWAWNQIERKLNPGIDPIMAHVDALTLVCIYAELCYCVCDSSAPKDDFWDVLGDFTEGMDGELMWRHGRSTDGDCPCDAAAALDALVRKNHRRVREALVELDAMRVLRAFHASLGKSEVLSFDEDGDDDYHGMIVDYGTFCRYVDDDAFRDADVNSMMFSDYECAYGFLMGGGDEML